MQYQDHGDYGEDSWGARARINLSGQVNDKVTVEGRLVSEFDLKDNSEENSSDVTMDRIHVVYAPTDNFAFDMGRTGAGLSQTGIFMDEDGYFDGIVADYSTEKFFAKAGYGRFDGGVEDIGGSGIHFNLHDYEAWFVKQYQSEGKLKPAANADDVAVWGVGAAIPLGSQFVIDGDYIKHADDVTDDASMWTAGLTYGEVDTEAPGSFSLGVHYADVDADAYLGGNSAWDMTDQLEYSLEKGAKFWMAKAGVAVMQNVELDAYYYFAGESKTAGAADPDDTFGVELNYFF